VPNFDVSVVGELNLDLIFYGLPETLQLDREHLARDLSITLGSSSAIFAHNLALLGNKVGFSSSIGSDPLGEICLQRLGESGVDLSRVLTAILPSGNQRYILTYPGTMFEMSYADLDLDYILNAKHFHLSSYYLQRALRPHLADLYRRAREAGLSTSLDTNDDPEDLWATDLFQVLKYVDVLLPNQHEACRIARTGDPHRAAEILGQIVPLVVIKRGAEGVLARRGAETFAAPAPATEFVDAVGAGDSFDAGFLHLFIRGAKIEDCLQFGNITGALSATRAGGTEAFRDAAHRIRFLSDRWPSLAATNSP
jgi:sugar/nucleoside kinase (ribokinase family)